MTYSEGHAAGLAWIDGDGAWYLDPDDDREGDYPEFPSQDAEQGFADAIKEAAWHAQHPGQSCALGEECRWVKSRASH